MNFQLAQICRLQREANFEKVVRSRVNAFVGSRDIHMLHERDITTGRTLLHDCVLHGTVADLRVLLQARASPLDKDNTGETPLSLAVWAGKSKTVQSLLREDLDLESRASCGPLLLQRVCSNGQASMLQQLLEAKCDVRESIDGNSPYILTALRSGSADCVELLIRAGASVECIGHDGETALHVAVSKHINVLKSLLEALKRQCEIPKNISEE